MSPALLFRVVRHAAFTIACAAVWCSAAAAFSGAPRGPLAPGAPRDTTADPLVPMIGRLDAYFRSHEADGVALDSRYDLAPSEVIRLSVVSQILGYAELERAAPLDAYSDAIRSRAQYLLPRIDMVRSGSTFDGMLGYAFLEAYAFTGDSACFAAGHEVVDEILALSPDQTVLNGGLMGVLALARWAQLTGDDAAANRAHAIIASLAAYQNDDGSFPHWCGGTEDIHYTAWMTQELILIGRMFDDPAIAPTLQRMLAFLEARIAPDGHTMYTGPCDDSTDCVRYYSSRLSGCSIDTDTRAFTNEKGYTSLLFDTFHTPEYGPVIRSLRSIENAGTFKDKWDFVPTSGCPCPPGDDYYDWSIADTSVVNMSVLFWSLAATWSGREHHGPTTMGGIPLARAPDPTGHAVRGTISPAAEPALVATPVPARETCALRFSLASPSRVTLAVHDVLGRRVRLLADAFLATGTHDARWDLRDELGARVGPGVYFVRLTIAGRSAVTRVAVTL